METRSKIKEIYEEYRCGVCGDTITKKDRGFCKGCGDAKLPNGSVSFAYDL
jgi:rRNA maturation endonuclease Nob1